MYFGILLRVKSSRNELLDEIRDHLLTARKDGKTVQNIFDDEVGSLE
ncbi:hypothetical protein [Terrilactibacillus laevilacticus]|uniref:Resolvase/invertase-type recombinase catalytic domain-containing protein n=1 Tax=Terrilactibacillus laevilacticus TaxID=1380157 RepID=A0ABW5PQC7_9BACI|nr:hypothetical protein [Terrilactibacillus laevilacticus]